MPKSIRFPLLPQPTDTTCGPTCLHALYRFHGKRVPMKRLLRDIRELEGGGTVAVQLALDALKRGFDVQIYTYNLQVFDPTWFALSPRALIQKLRAQKAVKPGRKLREISETYVEFLKRGGEVRFRDLTPDLLRRHLREGHPILTGLSSTYLYRSPREREEDNALDDVRGLPTGHFVVLAGYDPETRMVLVADPYRKNPYSRKARYWAPLDRVVGAVYLGIVTYDANLVVLRPQKEGK